MNMKKTIRIAKNANEELYCSLCNGKCHNKDNKITQENAKKFFGIIPNHCVTNSSGYDKCPYKG